MRGGSATKTPDGANAERTRSSAGFLGEIYRQVWPELCRYVMVRYGGGPPEPEEVAQTAFAKFVALERPQYVENPRAFLFQTVRNIVTDYHRHGGRRDAYLAEFRNRAEEHNGYEISPEGKLLEKERFRILADVLRHLPAQHRRMVLLNRYEGLTCEEIGRRFGMSAAAVQKQIVRTLAKCAAEIEAAGARNGNGSR
jgi:RNA polymerase sigma factor (sigma-70 family)